MADILRRSLAPITDEAWTKIEEQAAQIIRGNLSGRLVVDFSGPQGWGLGAVNLGRVDITGKKPIGGVQWGIRQVLPLVETRLPFSLSLMELDSVSRGAKNPDLDALEKASEKSAVFEEKAVYQGFGQAGIDGILPASPHKPIPMTKKAADFQAVVERAVVAIEKEGISGGRSARLSSQAAHRRGHPRRSPVESGTEWRDRYLEAGRRL
jgi:uncharacterized linocin/CFP29 family protein